MHPRRTLRRTSAKYLTDADLWREDRLVDIGFGKWGPPDPRFRVSCVRLFGPFYSVRIWDESQGGRSVYCKGGSWLTGRSSVHRAIHYSTLRYLERHLGPKG